MKESRCNRESAKMLAMFGSETYSKEELVAEMGSGMALNKLGIDTEKSFNNSTAYIQSWLEVLRNDKKFVVSAAGKAEKAVKYIFNEMETENNSQSES
jgi:antirestriction protein ArdC